MWLVFRGGGFSSGRVASAGDPAGGDSLGSAAGAERSGAKRMRTMAVLGLVNYVMSRMGDVAFLEFGSGGTIAFWHPSARVFNVDIIKMEVGGCLPTPRLKVGKVNIT